MSTILARAFVTLALGATAMPPAGPGLAIRNAGFEAGKADRADAWHWWSRTKHGSARRTDEDKHGGTHSMCIRHDGPRDWAFSSDALLPARAGQHFRVSGWAKVQTGSVTLAVVARSKGQTLSWDIGSASSDRDRWCRLDAPVSVPAGADQIHVRFVGDAATLAWVDDVALVPWTPPAPKPRVKVTGYAFAGQRVREKLGRGVVAVPANKGKVHVSWRLLADDPESIGFHVYRRVGNGKLVRRTDKPVGKTTGFLDEAAPAGAACSYAVRAVTEGKEGPASAEARVADDGYLPIKLKGNYTFQKAGIADLDGDGRYDVVIKQPHSNIDPWYKYWHKSPGTYKLEAYRHDGTFLWRYDMGWAIERGIWYSPYVVADLDGDGKAEVAVKAGQGDPRDAEGKVRAGPEYLAILDGLTGKVRARVAWPDRKHFTGSHGYNYASRNQLGVAYLDGKTPCVIVERGTYNVILVDAYEFHGDKLRKLWSWSNRDEPRTYWGQGAHWMHSVDVDGDGRDEVVLGSAVLDDTGAGLWTTGLGHPDHAYVGDLDPTRAGLEIYYGMETRQKQANGMCMVDAATSKVLWGHQGFTRHVHSCGMCSDIDANHVGAECYSADTDEKKKAAWARLRTSRGKVLSEEMTWGFGPRVVYWDADAQREILHRGRIRDYGGAQLAKITGQLVAVADVLGDWREEIITSVPGEMRIYVTPIAAVDRHVCLMQDPLYRADVVHAAMGYYQVPLLSYDLATGAAGGK